MKKLLALLFTVLLTFACSKDSATPQDQLQADLTTMTPSKALDLSSDGLYVGVFGHNAIRELHGKVIVNNNNNGDYSALIELTNGNNIKFSGQRVSKTQTHFTGERGSFSFNASDIESPIVGNVFIDDATESYIVVRKATRGGIPWVLTGTYEETGNEANFYGNWDAIGDGVNLPGFSSARGGAFYQTLAQIVVSHLGTSGPLQDMTMENNGFFTCGAQMVLPRIYDYSGALVGDSLWAASQTSSLNGADATWDLSFDGGFAYLNKECTEIDSSGYWAWNGKTGVIYSDLFTPPTLAGSMESH